MGIWLLAPFIACTSLVNMKHYYKNRGNFLHLIDKNEYYLVSLELLVCKIISEKRLISKPLVIFCLFILFLSLINYLQYKITITLTTEKLVLQVECSGGVVVRALASH